MIKIKTICQVRHPRDSQLRGRDGGDGQPCRPGKRWDLWRRGDSMNLWMWRCVNNDFVSKVSVEVEVWDGPPGPRWCHCMRGPLSPDADSCDLWPWVLLWLWKNYFEIPWSHPEFSVCLPETSDIVNATCTPLKTCGCLPVVGPLQPLVVGTTATRGCQMVPDNIWSPTDIMRCT